MGYKLAGYDVIGNCEIDRDMNKLYVKNHHPKYNYLMDIRDFGQIDNDRLPEELFCLDIMDGSPPCSVFSMAGQREGAWNKEKVFREGQKKQKLDDLFFEFIKIAKKLQPKIVIAENVKGLVQGNAKGYVNEIFRAFKDAGYTTQLFLLNAAYMGVPQARERVFFISKRKDIDFPKLQLKFNEKLIPFGEVRSEKGVPIDPNSQTGQALKYRKHSDACIADINKRLWGKDTMYTCPLAWDDRVMTTVTSGATCYRAHDGMRFSDQDFINVQTFPQDYDFMDQSPQYVCGMSVPPLMMANIAKQVELQWLRSGDR